MKRMLSLWVACVLGCGIAGEPGETAVVGAPSGPQMAAKGEPELPDGPISAELRDATIAALLRELPARYVYPDRTAAVVTAIRERQARGEYAGIDRGQALARALTDHVNEVLKDAHFGVRFSAARLPERREADKPTAEEEAEYARMERMLNGGFERAERLPGNIGYIEVRSFGFTRRGFDAAAAAMAFVADTDALIFDLRRNGGGDPNMVAALTTWLFADSVHLNDIYFRPDDATRQFWTLPGVPGRRYLDRAVYVLTSKSTGSGAEEFAYNLQQLKRATIVGETTWGGANPGEVVRLNDHFSAFVPNGAAINPITKTNWEGVGVKPDVASEADDALRVAQVEILEKKIAGEQHPELRRGLEERLRELAGK
ncbi:MAG: S41 family peptidase [Myxococcales bacterium]|nr:S41 family peptidase [Myxococcales bacterium]